jgi:RNA polymerase sigma-70 factor (ECF subfamily)
MQKGKRSRRFNPVKNVIFAKFFISLTDNELKDIIDRCRINDPIAQERLYKYYFALMYTICKSYSENQQTIISLINEGFLKIFMNIKTFDFHKGHFESWAKKIITNTAIDYTRSKKSVNQFLAFDEECGQQKELYVKPNNGVEEEVLYLIKKMPAVTQQVFSLHVFNGYSHKEIADMLQIAESTSRWHVAEARKNLRRQAHKIY